MSGLGSQWRTQIGGGGEVGMGGNGEGSDNYKGRVAETCVNEGTRSMTGGDYN